MREKPVPVRVDKELQSFHDKTSMDAIKEEANFEKETDDNASENAVSKELPSMVPIVPLNSSDKSPSKHDTRLYQTAFEYRPSLDIPGEFEFLNKDSVSESQKQAVKFGVRVFRDWLHKQGVEFQSLEDMSRSELANALEQFYLTARRPNGTQYKKNTLKSIKHSLDHYFRSSPFKKDFSISTDYDFRQVNKTLDNLPEDADQNRFPQFTKETILKLYKSGQLGLSTTDDPSIIIQTVWFYIVSYFFTNIDKRMLRELKESNLILATDDEGREYYWLDYKPPERIRGDVDKSRIYGRPGSLCCPVAIIKKYMEHRNPRNDVLFQHPKRISHIIWYSPLPLGKNKHTDLMKSMCVNAGVDPPLTGRCIRSYVRDLLQECDQAVNDMFRLEGPTTPMTMHGVVLSKFPGDTDPSLIPPFILSVPRLPSPILSTSVSSVGTISSSHFSIQPHAATSNNHITNHITTTSDNHTTNQNGNGSKANNHTTTQSNHATGQYGRHLTIQGNHIISSPGPSPLTHVAAFPNGTHDTRIVLPYLNTFPTLNDFAKPKESYNGTQNNSSPHYRTEGQSDESSNHQNGTGMDTSDGTSPSQIHIGLSPFPTLPVQQTASVTQSPTKGSLIHSKTTTAEISTQTETTRDEWLESTYHKADLKTRNKMRLQARKSLLSFLEELNDISDGHGTELFYEIVEEDMNMWKSITKPTSSK